jgi:hypothetical protein
MAAETCFVPDATLAQTKNVYWPPETRPATCCWMIGVAVTAVMVSAVVLPSGAVVVFAVAEDDPPFLSQVATVKSSEYFAMFSKGPPTV